MKLSVSNIAWQNRQDKVVYEMMKKYGFSGLEIAPTRIFPDRPYENIIKAMAWQSKLQEQYGFTIPSMQSIWFGRTENFFRSEAERKILLEYTKQAIQFASAISCRNLVFGCPKNRSVPTNANTDVAEHFFYEIAEYALEHNTVIGIEANPESYQTNYINYTSQALQLIEQINSEGLRLNLDVGTMLYYQEPLELLFQKISYISHVHISEPQLAVIKSRKLHVELADLLLSENFQGYVSIEMGRRENMNEIERAMEYVSRVFG